MKAMPACELEHHSLSLRHQGDAHVSGLSKFMDFMIAFRIWFGHRGLMCTYRSIWNRFYCATLYASVAPRIYDLESCRSIQVTSNRNFWIPHFFFHPNAQKDILHNILCLIPISDIVFNVIAQWFVIKPV